MDAIKEEVVIMRVVLSGYFGFDNVGDEAILFSIIRALRNLEPSIEITVLSNNPAETAATYGVDTVNRWNIAEVRAALKSADGLISGGGSLMQDATSGKTIPYYAGVIKLAQMAKVPVFIYSQGIGPINGALGKWLVKSVFNKCAGITVRDEASFALLREIGVRPPVSVVPDPVVGLGGNEFKSAWLDEWLQVQFQLGVNDETASGEDAGLNRGVDVAGAVSDVSGDADVVGVDGGAVGTDGGAEGIAVDTGAAQSNNDVNTNSPSAITGDTGVSVNEGGTDAGAASSINDSSIIEIANSGALNSPEDTSISSPYPSYVSVSVRDWPSEVDFKAKVAAALDSLAARGLRIMFIPMHGEHDVKASKDVAELMSNVSTIAPGDLSIEEKIAVIGGSKLLIGQRLHSLIFAAIEHIPFIALSYDPKIDAFSEIVAQPVIGHVERDDWDGERLAACAVDILDNYETKLASLRNMIDPLQASAENTAQMALDAFKSK